MTLTPEQIKNVEYIIKRMGELGFTNPYIQAGILAVISKESSFVPKSERSYANTDSDRIKKIFKSRLGEFTIPQIDVLKNNPKAFFDAIYGDRYGNAKDEGYKYRGRGLNQITFKTNYESINKYTKKDIVADPDSLNELPTATEAAIGYFKRAFGKSDNKLKEYNMTDANNAKNTMDAVGVAYHANTGWGKNKANIANEPTSGYKKAIARVDQFYAMAKNGSVAAGKEAHEDPTETPRKKPTPTIIASGDVTANSLNVRSGPGTEFSTTSALEKGTTVHVYQKEGRWLKISTTEAQWIHGNYVDESAIPKPADEIIAEGKVTATVLNIRSGPDTKFDKVGSLTEGDTVNVYKKEGRWLKINSTEAQWVHGNYVDE
jgi:predicted chitinase/uncharacterized protein YraI